MNTTETIAAAYPVTPDKEATTPPKAKTAVWKKSYFLLTHFVLALMIADWLWAMSGSNQWELVKEGNGVKTYSLKASGDKLVKVKSVMEGKYTLSQLISQHIIDDNLETCKSWIPNCMEFTRIQDFDPVTGYDKDMWRLDFPFPFDDRELLINTIVAQDKKSKAVTLDVVALPNTLPHEKGVVRVERMHNRWKFTPLANGNVEVELIQDTDLGGFFPYFLMNLVTPDEGHKFFSDELGKSLQQKKYVNAKFPFINDIR